MILSTTRPGVKLSASTGRLKIRKRFLFRVNYMTVGSKEPGRILVKLLSVDPGKHTGWAAWDFWEGGIGKPELIRMGVTPTIEDFFDLLLEDLWGDLSWIVYEDYKIRPRELNHKWGHEWSGAPALHVIGGIEFYARQRAIQQKAQPASILPVGCGFIGYNYRKGVHVPNNVSAIAHGAYWLVKNKHANSRGFKTLAS